MFIERAKAIHGDRYDYTNIIYINMSTHIIIICTIHDIECKIMPNHHISHKNGACKLCRNQLLSEQRLVSIDIIIQNAILKHGNLYNYSNTKRVGKKQMTIICSIHGEYIQRIADHVNKGSGCLKCRQDGARSNTIEFIEKANKVHNNKFDYSQSVYIKAHSKITIICPKHGSFEQEPNRHLAGDDCNKCSVNGFSKFACKWLDEIALERNIYIQHALNIGEKSIGKYKVDGFCETTNTVFEAQGNYWHLCPTCYKPGTIHPVSKKSMEEIHRHDAEKADYIKALGYNLEIMWECVYRGIHK
jgi:hypothetical protein